MGTDDDDEESSPTEELNEIVGDETMVGDISSLHTLSGTHTPRSLQLAGSIRGRNLRVLVDSGSTHNFIQPSIASLLKLPIEEIPSF